MESVDVYASEIGEMGSDVQFRFRHGITLRRSIGQDLLSRVIQCFLIFVLKVLVSMTFRIGGILH